MTLTTSDTAAPDAGTRETPAADCITPGVCSCPGMTRCPKCGYTAHDAAYLMDHRRPYCDGVIPARQALARATAPTPSDAGRDHGEAGL